MRDLEIAALVGAAGFAAYAYSQHDNAGDGLGKKANTCGRGGPCYPKKKVPITRHKNLNPHQQSLIDKIPKFIDNLLNEAITNPFSLTGWGQLAQLEPLVEGIILNDLEPAARKRANDWGQELTTDKIHLTAKDNRIWR